MAGAIAPNRPMHSQKSDTKQKVRPRIDGSTWAYIEQLIREEWSPEQISGWMKKNLKISISHEWIYHFSQNQTLVTRFFLKKE